MLSILLLAFGLNALAPSGYMIAATDGGWPAVVVCPETHPLARAVAASREERESHDMGAMDHASMGHAVMDHAAMGHGGDDGTAPVTANDGHCALASAVKLALHSADEALLAEAMAYAVQLGFRPIRPLIFHAPAYLRPPLRGPPLAI